MKKKIFHSTMLVAVSVLLASFTIIMSCLYDYFGGVQEQQLKDELSLAIAGVENSGRKYLEDLDHQEYRLTWVASDGDVLFDNKADEHTMENHEGRREIQEAFETGEGAASRYSSTIMEKTIYYARRMKDGTVLRISVNRATAGLLLIGMLRPIAAIIIFAILLSAVLSRKMARRITDPLNKLNLDQPLENDAYEELSPLLERIYRQHCQIDSALRELKRRKEDFSQITDNMKEGLVLLNEKGLVISINPAARQIFQTDNSCIGKDFLSIERNYAVSQALDESFKVGHSEIRQCRNDIEYQFDFSRIESDGQTVGVVLLAFDVTERACLERIRREFTANVSHELKTPLQSIMGSAELIENGMVQQKDMPRFVGHIRTESARLVTLIDDIIHLSQMDEGTQLTMEKVDLQDVANEAVEAVKDAAHAKQIDISLTGGSAVMQGVPQFLFELAYNLCDNAVKYNKEHGTIEVTVSQTNETATIAVKDSGIGIPQEHLHRIFERFYRIDKSHSKQSGGTGLGLSIVKHAAICHHAKIDIQSEVGVGTTITVVFPKVQQLN